jgi:Ca2+-binding RTX toxin-like protein
MPKTIKSPVVLEPDEDLSIAQNEEYVAVGDSSFAVSGRNGGHYVRVAGTVTADYGAIAIGEPYTITNDVVEITSSGHVKGKYALLMDGGANTIVNHGVIEATGDAVWLSSEATLGSSVITNTGTITGAVGLHISTFDVVQFENSGLVEGSDFSYVAWVSFDHIDRITNTGKMVGDISLDTEDDRYNGKSGVVHGIVSGGDGADRLIGGTEKNNLQGDAGTDRLQGGRGADKLTGGFDADTFVYTSIQDSPATSTGRDHIIDFSQVQADILDLHAIDANANKQDNQSFKFIEDAKFDKHAGELRYQFQSGDTIVSGDTNGDGRADFSIALDGEFTLLKQDFML